MTITQELRLFLGYSLNEMRDFKQTGRITDRLYRHYLTLWRWGQWRDCHIHQRYYDRMGPAVYWRRIDRIKALIERIRAVEMPPSDRIPFAVGSINH
jgi:hypothetical protein